MKTIFCLLFSFYGFQVVAQDSSKVINSMKVSFPKPTPVLRAELSRTPLTVNNNVEGNFKITKIDIIHKTENNQSLIQDGVGSVIIIKDSLMMGNHMNPFYFVLQEAEKLERDEFLYRSFGKIPSLDLSHLPSAILSRQTWATQQDVGPTYGIGVLPYNEIIIPYDGLLIYLKKM